MVIVLYVLGLLVVAAVLYAVAALVFGRGDQTPPLEAGATPTVLPAEDVTGADIRALRFQQVIRGYKPAEVDWALDRLAREIDVLRVRLAQAQAGAPSLPTGPDGPAADGDSSGPQPV